MALTEVNLVDKACSCIDEQDAIAFLQKLVRINSVNPPGTEKAVAEAIKNRLVKAGIAVKLDEVAPNRTNLFAALSGATTAYVNGQQTSTDKVLAYSGHFDTVPIGEVEWKHAPFGGDVINRYMYGRGTADMKAGVAAMVLALECLQRAGIKLGGTLRFVGTVGEEVDCFGAKQIMQKGQIDDTTAMVISEPSANEIFCAHKGALWIEVTVYGKTAHGSMPEQGVNAIQLLTRFIGELDAYEFEYEEHPLLGEPTMNIGTIHGGIKTNVVPDRCTCTLDIRTVPGQNHDEIVEQLRARLDRLCNMVGASYDIRIANDMPPLTTDSEDTFVQLTVDCARKHTGQSLKPKGVCYFTDGSVFAPHLHVPTFIYGPGEPTMAHQPDEWVEVDKYLASIRFFIAMAIEYLGGSEAENER